MSYSYDLEGHLVQSSDTTGVRTWTYDANGRKISATDPRGNTQANWDGVGNLLWQTDVTGRKITNSYNTNYQLTQVVDSTDNGTATLTYTADGQLNTCLYPNGVEVAYTYDAAGRVTNLTHTNTANGTLVVGYAATYLNNGQLSKVTESPSGDVTAYSYDPAGNLLNEVRTGQRSYSGTYTYWSDGNRKTADVITNGITVHNGSYSYDGAGRLDQCIDSATGLTEIYTWNADGTLASMPGPSYTREFSYNEEAQLLGISHSGTLAYQYAYGADGNRRWSKDIANDLWTWYPCGVACGAGEMVEEISTLTGSSWSTSGQYLRAGGGCSSLLIRRKSSTDDEYHHEDMVGVFGVLTNATGTIIQNNLSDAYMVPQYIDQNGQVLSRQTAICLVSIPEPDMQSASNGTIASYPARALYTTQKLGAGHVQLRALPCGIGQDTNILCIIFGIDCHKKKLKKPQACNGPAANCEACQSALYNECLKIGDYPGICYAISLACEEVCTDQGDGSKLYKCWTLGGKIKRHVSGISLLILCIISYMFSFNCSIVHAEDNQKKIDIVTLGKIKLLLSNGWTTKLSNYKPITTLYISTPYLKSTKDGSITQTKIVRLEAPVGLNISTFKPNAKIIKQSLERNLLNDHDTKIVIHSATHLWQHIMVTDVRWEFIDNHGVHLMQFERIIQIGMSTYQVYLTFRKPTVFTATIHTAICLVSI